MLPASNKGVGMNMGFPDVCLTPAVPSPVPIPYPNMAMNAMAAPFCPTILLSMMPALNMGSIIPMTLGMQPGVANPLYMQMGMYTMGNPKIVLQGLPAINLTCPTTGNAMNNPVGAVLVPSVTNVFFTRAGAASSEPAEGLGATELRDLHRSLGAEGGEPTMEAPRLHGQVGSIVLRRFSSGASAGLHHAVQRLLSKGMRSLTLDLRGNPGGELQTFLHLAAAFLDPGSLIATLIDGDGDRTEYRARQPDPYRFPLVVVVDRRTASAAELFAGCMKCSGRAVVVGEPTYGKGSAQALVQAPGRGPVYATVARLELPDGTDLDGKGVEPDLHLTSETLHSHEGTGWVGLSTLLSSRKGQVDT